MNIGIIGHGEDKFTDLSWKYPILMPSAEKAKEVIEGIVISAMKMDNPTIVSGHSPLGGVDIWTEGIAKRLHCNTRIFAPIIQQWDPDGYGYKARNMDIAITSNDLHVIVVSNYPPGYQGIKFNECYHCHTISHVKSGACWTAKKFAEIHNKLALYWIVNNR